MEYYPRLIEEKLENMIGRKEYLIIKGPRQAGKTTLMLHLKNKYGGHYITLEDFDILDTFERDTKAFAERFLDKRLLFIDEIQYSQNAGKNLKLLYDLYSDRLKLVLSGSGSFDIKENIGKYLVGRCLYFELFPLCFEEFVLWKKKDLYKIYREAKQALIDFIMGNRAEIRIAFAKEFQSLFEEYLIYGGFPAIVKEPSIELKEELLKNLARTYLEKDVFFFFDIRHLEKFRMLMRYLAFNIGSIIEYSSLAQEARVDYKTLVNYISILNNTYIIFPVSPYRRNLATELKKAKKLYFVDTGLRNSIIGDFSEISKREYDKSKLYENFVFNELRMIFKDIHYWRTTGKAEVDFVLNINSDVVPVEVKSKPKLERSLYSFFESYKPKRALILNESELGMETIKGVDVLFAPIYLI